MSISSPYPAVDIPTGTVYDHVFGSLDDAELSKIAVIDGDTSISYGQLRDGVDRFAGALAARGVGVGDVVALQAPNSLGFVIAFHGILRAGATATTVNALYSQREIATQLRDSGATMYVTVAALLPQALEACAHACVGSDRIIVLDGAPGFRSLADLLESDHLPPAISIDPARALAVLPYSSGTTGKAKGVMLTHRNLVANIAQCTPALRLGTHDNVLAVLPLFHIYGMNVIMNLTLSRRATLVTLPRFDLSAFLAAIEARACSVIYIAPPIAVALTKSPDLTDRNLSSVRLMVCGAAPMDEALGRALFSCVPARLLQGFGMTELSPVSHLTPLDAPELSVGSVGVAIPNIEFKVVDPETQAEVEYTPGVRSAPGEMLVRGPGVMVGYLGNSQATAETITGDGYLRTGDIVEIGPRGEVYVVDRLKELIKYKGYQVPPAELEALLLTHPAIADAAVVAHPHEEAGEIPRAFVVRDGGQSAITAADVMDFVAQSVAPHKRIRMVDFIDVVPKAPSGKILRKDLKGLPRNA
ncbi:4-coumarate--CoA ligase family protein [Mycobacterium sp. CBMA 234]|uniref:AMP-binding protein n=1 Tax=Mycolicibacterium sp. CBMA 234 TaxID=1918495 RepID=UPI0012DD6FFF|nr:AMP-binding protein [Mycolicibacterium sp. CBMA 234]MUL66850.1 4-coumarate--CoA ligase family protein [Mycolicibacterium sp. CBMA 234]